MALSEKYKSITLTNKTYFVILGGCIGS